MITHDAHFRFIFYIRKKLPIKVGRLKLKYDTICGIFGGGPWNCTHWESIFLCSVFYCKERVVR